MSEASHDPSGTTIPPLPTPSETALHHPTSGPEELAIREWIDNSIPDPTIRTILQGTVSLPAGPIMEVSKLLDGIYQTVGLAYRFVIRPDYSVLALLLSDAGVPISELPPFPGDSGESWEPWWDVVQKTVSAVKDPVATGRAGWDLLRNATADLVDWEDWASSDPVRASTAVFTNFILLPSLFAKLGTFGKAAEALDDAPGSLLVQKIKTASEERAEEFAKGQEELHEALVTTARISGSHALFKDALEQVTQEASTLQPPVSPPSLLEHPPTPPQAPNALGRIRAEPSSREFRSQGDYRRAATAWAGKYVPLIAEDDARQALWEEAQADYESRLESYKADQEAFAASQEEFRAKQESLKDQREKFGKANEKVQEALDKQQEHVHEIARDTLKAGAEAAVLRVTGKWLAKVITTGAIERVGETKEEDGGTKEAAEEIKREAEETRFFEEVNEAVGQVLDYAARHPGATRYSDIFPGKIPGLGPNEGQTEAEPGSFRHDESVHGKILTTKREVTPPPDDQVTILTLALLGFPPGAFQPLNTQYSDLPGGTSSYQDSPDTAATYIQGQVLTQSPTALSGTPGTLTPPDTDSQYSDLPADTSSDQDTPDTATTNVQGQILNQSPTALSATPGTLTPAPDPDPPDTGSQYSDLPADTSSDQDSPDTATTNVQGQILTQPPDALSATPGTLTPPDTGSQYSDLPADTSSDQDTPDTATTNIQGQILTQPPDALSATPGTLTPPDTGSQYSDLPGDTGGDQDGPDTAATEVQGQVIGQQPTAGIGDGSTAADSGTPDAALEGGFGGSVLIDDHAGVITGPQDDQGSSGDGQAVVTPGAIDWLVPGQEGNSLFTDDSADQDGPGVYVMPIEVAIALTGGGDPGDEAGIGEDDGGDPPVDTAWAIPEWGEGSEQTAEDLSAVASDYAGGAQEQVELAQDAADAGDSDLSQADLGAAASLGALAGNLAGAASQGQEGASEDGSQASLDVGDSSSAEQPGAGIAGPDVGDSTAAALAQANTAVEAAQDGDPAESDEEAEPSAIDFGEDDDVGSPVYSVSLNSSLTLFSGTAAYQSPDSGVGSSADPVETSYVPEDPPRAVEWGPDWSDTPSDGSYSDPGSGGSPDDGGGASDAGGGDSGDGYSDGGDTDSGGSSEDGGSYDGGSSDDGGSYDGGYSEDGGSYDGGSYDGGSYDGGGESYEAPVEAPVESAPVDAGGDGS